MHQTFLAALCGQFARFREVKQTEVPSPPLLDAFVLEDRLLYSATALPVDAIESDGQSVPFEVTQSEIDALLERVDQDLGGATETSLSPALNSNTPTGNDSELLVLSALEEDQLGSHEAAQAILGENESGLADAIDQSDNLQTLASTQSQSLSVESHTQAAPPRHDVAFVDSSIDDLEQLLAQLQNTYVDGGTLDIVLVDRMSSGLDQISTYLAASSYDYSSIHLVTHGVPGSLQLGSDWLNAETISTHGQQIASWADALTADADLLMYGCQVASTTDGEALALSLASLIDVDVAVSTDTTGAIYFGGDWDLEFHVGQIDAHAFSTPADMAEWQGLLVNSAPVLTPYAPGYNTNENAASFTASVLSVLNGSASDVDMGTSIGIAVYASAGTGGVLEYSLDGGASWNTSGVLSANSALLLRSSDIVRFTPDSSNGGTLTADYRAWDQTSGVAGTKVDVTSNGGATAFSSATDRLSIMSTSLNDAPVLDNTGNMTLSTITEDQTGNAGNTVSSIFLSAGGDRVTDVDTGAVEGIAITSLGGTGTWQYSLDGVTWSDVGAVSDSSALLLRSSSNLRFEPDGSNATTGTVTFRAWDRSSGSAGTKVDASTNGGTSAFSTATEVASITVTAVNDAPNMTTSVGTAAYTENSPAIVIDSALTIADVDSADFSGGTLSVSISANATSNDRLTIAPSGALTMLGTGIYYSGTQVATMSGGLGTSPLVVTFNANSTPAIAQAVARQVGYFNVSDNPSTVTRTIDFVISDGDGGTSSTSQKLVSVAAVAEAPIAVNDQNGLKFDGIDDYVNLGSNASLVVTNQATMEVWVRPAAYPASSSIIINKEGEYEIGITSSGKLRWGFANTNPGWAWHDTGYTLAVNQWAHISVVYDNGVVSTYVNGSLVETYRGSGSIGDSHVTLNDLRVGGRQNSPSGQYFNGEIDDIRVWNIARTQAEVRTNLDTTLVGNESGLIGYWRFSDGSGTATLDSTANSNHGTLVDGGAGTVGPQWTGYTTNENSILSVAAATGLVSNDIDGDGDTLVIIQVNGSNANVGSTFVLPSGASLTLTATGSFTYDPNAAFNYLNSGQTATDTFTYQVSDGNGGTDTATATIRITGSNDAPTLSGANDFTTINEDSTANSGDLVSSLISSRFADFDTGAAEGIAITSLVSSNGSWEYSIDNGANWSSVGAVSNTSALLLRSIDKLRFIPNGLNADAGSITFRAWDQTSGTSGNKVDPSTNGNTTAFSTATAVASITVTAVNDAPVLDNVGTMTLTTITEDATTNSGDTVAAIIASAGGDRITDVDSGALEGIAITSLVSSNGTWQFSTDGGTNWYSVGVVSEPSALLLRASDKLRFVPDGSNADAGSVTFRAWDQTSGSFGTKVDVSTNGSTTAFSTSTEVASITVTSANDAPVLDSTGSITLTTITERATNNSGDTVAAIISSAGGDRITDVDSGAVEGIAITSLTSGTGTWQYSINAGSSWTAVGAVSNTSALLLRSDDLVRFIPNGQSATTGEFTFRAWDQTSQSAGTKVDTSTNGGTTPFSTSTETASITVTEVNDAPTAVADTPTAVEAGGTGNATAGTNPSGNVLTNDTDVDASDTKVVSGVAAGTAGSASGNVGSAVSGSYGSISIAANGAYTYSVDNSNATVQALRTSGNTLSDIFTYTMQDGSGASSTTQVTVTIQGANDAPHDLTSGTLTIAENASNGASVGTLSGSDIDSGDTLTFSLVDNSGGRFAINSSTGALTVADGTLLDRETSASHTITVRVTDAGGLSYDENFSVTVTDVDEFDTGSVSDVNATANTVAENAANGTTVGITASASDADSTTNTIAYTLFDNDGGRFAINSSTGVVTVAGGIDRETDGASRNITVRATSADGSFSDQIYAINISDVDEFDTSAVSDANAAANTVAENAANGTTVGITASASDADATTNMIAYSLADDDGGRFAINSSTGVVTVAGGIDRETDGASRNITVRATSADGSFSDQIYSINISDVDEFDTAAVSDANAAANTVAENAANGTTVGITASASDADATTNTIAYSLADDDGGRFAINSTTGVVTVAGGIDRETDGASRNITVRATSADGSFSDQIYSINISDVDEFDTGSVSDVNAAANTVAENAANGTTVGITASASDADATTNTIAYTLFDNDGGRFAINSSTGVVTVAGGIDREVDGTSRNITVRATSADGSFSDQIYAINISDVDEFDTSAVSDVNAAANTVAENAANGTTVGITAAASDADSTANTITYTLFNNDGGRFAIDSSTGVVTVAGAIDREADGASRNITVRATSADGSFSDQAYAISIGDVDEFDTSAVSDANAAGNTVAENAANGTTVGITAAASDADSTTNTITYTLFDNDGGRFAIDSSTGVVTVAGAIDREADGASRNITVRATSADGSFSDQAYAISIGDVDEFDTSAVSDANAAANTVAENAANGTTVGITAAASDADSTTNTITYTLFDNDGGRFAIDSSTGVVTVAGAIDRETDGASRNITVRATSADGSFSDQAYAISISDVDEFNTSAVSDANAAANTVAENAANGTTVGITAAASDADSTTNTITYTLFDNDGGRFAIDSSTGVVTVAGAIDRETDGASRNITVRATSADGSFSDQAYAISIGDVDEFNTSAVSDANAAANTVAENAANGTTVGITAAASDADSTTNTITYTLFDNDGGRFAIDSSTGVVTVAGAIDRETDGASRNITVRATSADGSFSDQAYAISITDVNDFNTSAVSDTNVAANAVAENATNGTAVGITASASDADATSNTITYTLFDNDGGRFAINSSTGVVTVAGAIDREADGASRNITVRATSADGSFSDQAYAISIGDVDEFDTSAVSDANAAGNTVAENAANGTTVGITAAASDADSTTNTITYTLFNNDGGRFAIDSSTGVVTVAGAIDREADGASRNITVRATSADGSFSDQAYAISITDVNDFNTSAVSDANAAANTVAENAANGTTVGITAAASDADSTTNTITYTLFDNDGGRFAIDSSTGVVTVAGAIDRETDGASRNITVRATSADGSFSDQAYAISIGDVDEFDTSAVSDANAAGNTVAENAANGTTVGITAAASDADSTTNTITYTLFDNDGGRFAIDSSTGVVTVAGAIDRETDGASRNITVRATSADGSFSDQAYAISITDVDEFNTSAVSDVDAGANTVAENAANGTTVGITAAASDADSTTNTVTYTLFDNDGGRFAIDSSTGVVTVAGAIDREADGASRNITVRATSADGSFSDQAYAISIGDVDEFDTSAVSDANAAANTVAENAANGTAVGITASASDADSTTNTITYTLFDNDGGRFAINSSTGVVTVAGAIDRESDGASRNITVRATSVDGSFSDQAYAISIGDVDEFNTSAVSDVDAAANAVAENSANGTTVGITASASDADSTTNSITYTLFNNDGGRFAIDSSTGVVTVAGAINREADGATRNITVRATSADGSFSDQAYAISIGDVDEFNTSAVSDANAAANTVNENATNGTVVSITGLATDADATNNAITYTLDDDSGGRFAINGMTGVVTVADGTLLDYESSTSHTIDVRATSADGSFSMQTFSVLLSDVNEASVTAVVDADAAANEVLENAANGSVVGISGWADDFDGTDTVAYSLDDNAGGRFSINSTTGVVTVAGAINRETAASYNITVRATSTDTSISTQSFTINVVDVDEFNTGAVSDTNATANAITENAAAGTAVGITASAVDGDATNNAITYTLFDDDGGRFAIAANTGVVTLAGAVDRESDGASRNIVVRATSADGSHTDQSYTINVIDVDEFDTSAVTDANAAANTVAENAVVGSTVGVTGTANDSDATTNTITYSLQDNDGGRFAINSSTGIVTVAGAIDREADGASRNIVVRATSADGSYSEQTFAISIGDVDEFNTGAVSDSNATANRIAENAAAGTTVGVTAAATDADATTNAMTYSLQDSDSGRFAVDSATGIVTLLGSIDREADGPSRTIVVRATSADGSFTDQSFTITVDDVDEFDTGSVTDGNAAANAVDENAAIGTAVGVTASASDDDATNNSISYSLADDDSGRFAINSSTGIVTVAGAINRETDGASRSIVVRATSADGSFSDQAFAISIGDVDEFDVSPISDSAPGANSVDENAAVGSAVGVVAAAIDADSTTNAVTYSLDDNAGGRFSIDAATGSVKVAGGNALNYEANSSHSITVRATSVDGSFTTRGFLIALNDVNEFAVSAVADTNATVNSVAENSLAGTLVGLQASATDADGTHNTVTYALLSDAGGRFSINAATGVVSVSSGADLDYEASAAHSITVRANSVDGSFSDQAYSILVSNVNEAPVVASQTFTTDNVTLLSVAAPGIMAGTIDAEGDQLTLQLLSGPAHGTLVFQANGAFTYKATSGFTGTDTFVLRASDGQLSSAATTVVLNVTIPNAVNGGGGSSSGGSNSGSSTNKPASSTDSSSSAETSTGSGEGKSTDASASPAALVGSANYNDSGSANREEKPDEFRDAAATGEVAAEAADKPAQASQRGGNSQNTVEYGGEVNSSGVIDVHRGFEGSRSEEALRVQMRGLSTDTLFLHSDEERQAENHDRNAFTFVAPAKWTVISTGMVIWAVRVGQVIATLASTASAFIPFDPLNVIQQANFSGTKDDDKEANSFTEKLFDNQQKK